MKQTTSPTWILFASGNGIAVELSLYDPARERSRPIEAYIVSEVGADLARSASRAAETIYATAHASGITPPPTVVGYDLPGLEGGSSVSGQSAGLALALALAKKLWPAHDPGPVAATGEISSAGNGGPLKKIAGFNGKGEAVIDLLPDGGWFFYPRDNDPEISDSLRQSWQEHNIEARPVASVAEALAIFIPGIVPGADHSSGPEEETGPEPEPPPLLNWRRFAILIIFATLLSAGLAAAVLFQARRKLPHPTADRPRLAMPAKSGPDREPARQTAAARKTPPGEKKEQQKTPALPASEQPPPTPDSTKTATTKTAIARAEKLPEITLRGTSGVAETMAGKARIRLKELLGHDVAKVAGINSITGRIELIEIRERWNPESEKLRATVTAACHGRIRRNDGSTVTLALPPVTVSGYGSMAEQLDNAAALISERIKQAVIDRAVTDGSVRAPNRAPDKAPSAASGADRGFE